MTYFIFSSMHRGKLWFLTSSSGQRRTIEQHGMAVRHMRRGTETNYCQHDGNISIESTFIVRTYRCCHAEVSRMTSNHTWLLNYPVVWICLTLSVFWKKKGKPYNLFRLVTWNRFCIMDISPRGTHLCCIKNTLSRLIHSQVLHSSDILPNSPSSAQLDIFYLAPRWYVSKLSTQLHVSITVHTLYARRMMSSFLMRRCWD